VYEAIQKQNCKPNQSKLKTVFGVDDFFTELRGLVRLAVFVSKNRTAVLNLSFYYIPIYIAQLQIGTQINVNLNFFFWYCNVTLVL
jgi:hypothetical protein